MKKKKTIKNYIFGIVSLVIIAALIIVPFAMEKNQASDEDYEIRTTTPENGSVSSTLAGSGTLTSQEAVTVSVPEGVQLTELLVKDGDIVSEGDPIAIVDRVSVMNTVTQVQETLEYLNDEIEDARDNKASTSVTAAAAGRVMAVYAAAGDSVQEVMAEHGALAVLSLDGMTSVSFEPIIAISAGASVTVKTSDGTEYPGSVETLLSGTATVTLTDDGPTPGDTVSIYNEDGVLLGTGTLEIHCPWLAVAYTGTVSTVYVKEGAAVTASKRLFTLTDTADSSEFEVLLAKHAVYEQMMRELFTLYYTETLHAPSDGIIYGTDSAELLLLRSTGDAVLTFLANEPIEKAEEGEETEEVTYTNRVGVVKSIDGSSITMGMLGGSVSVSDYASLSGYLSRTADMTNEATPSFNAPIYTYSGGWTQISLGSVGVNDVLLFTYDSNGLVWIIKIGTASSSETPGENPGGEGGEGGQGGQGFPGGGMSGFGGYGSAVEETAYELYSTEEVTVCEVTPAETVSFSMTVDELDILSAQIGQKALVTVDALVGQSFEGTVTEISTEGTVNEGGHTKYAITVELARTADMLAGMNASAVITLESHENVLLLPLEAVAEVSGKTVVYTAQDKEGNLTGEKEITCGLSDENSVEVLSGLTSGETIYYPCYTGETNLTFTAPANFPG